MANNDQPQPRTIIGTISEFKPEKERWVNYKKRLDAWMRINKIDDGDKVDAFISLVGPEVVDLLVALVSPANIEDQVKKRLRNRLVAGVRTDAIKNRLLSEEAALTWDKAVEISTSMDTARQNSKMMKPSEAQEVNRVRRGGYQHSSRGRGKPRQKCYR